MQTTKVASTPLTEKPIAGLRENQNKVRNGWIDGPEALHGEAVDVDRVHHMYVEELLVLATPN